MKGSGQKAVFSMTNPTISRNNNQNNGAISNNNHQSMNSQPNSKTLAQNLMKGF
jgi:hypothetical protein